MINDKKFSEQNSIEKDYERAVCTTSSIASWLIKSVIFVLLLLVFK